MGKLDNIYAYQTGKGVVESGILMNLTSSKKKAYQIGTLSSIKSGAVRNIFRHQVIKDNISYNLEYILLITEWENDIVLFLNEILPGEPEPNPAQLKAMEAINKS